MTDYSHKTLNFVYLVILLPFALFILGVVRLTKVNKTIKHINHLNEKGHLVKDLPFYLEYKGNQLTDTNDAKPLEYVYAEHNGHKFGTDSKINIERIRKYQTIDLLVDDSNPDIYYLEFNIDPKKQ